MVVASQSVSWFLGQILRLRFAVESNRPPDFVSRAAQRCLILAPTHQSVLDPWLIISALRYREWRALVPVRTLATTTFGPPLTWFTPVIRILYRLLGVIELPHKEEGGTLREKVQGLVDALRAGDLVAIFPEGGGWKERRPAVREFAPGVVYLQRQSGAEIAPMAVWLGEQRWPRRRYHVEIGRPVRIPESLDLEEGATWLRERTLELYERAGHRVERE